MSRTTCTTCLSVALVLGTGSALAQTPVCSNAPAADERIECAEGANSTNDIDIDAQGVDIDTMFDGMGFDTEGLHGIHAEHAGTADIDIIVTLKLDDLDVTLSTVHTDGNEDHGVWAHHTGTVDARNLDLTTRGTGIYRGIGTLSHGFEVIHEGIGHMDVDVTGGFVMTAGSYSYGIYGRHFGNGNIDITTGGGHTVTTTGDNAHGIVAYHYGVADEDYANTSNTIDITVGGTVDTTGDGAHGVLVGTVNADGNVERVAAVGADGYRRQTVRVNGSVRGGSGEGAGIFLAGGGKVYIGPHGTVGADSGIAIRASGDTPAENAEDPPIKPNLLIDMDLDGRRVADVIGDDWIINDGGETTIVVNGVKLHDGAMGVVLTRRAGYPCAMSRVPQTYPRLPEAVGLTCGAWAARSASTGKTRTDITRMGTSP